MKKTLLASTVAISTLSSIASFADGPSKKDKVANDLSHLSTFAASATAGALIGGPLGMFIGAIGSAFIIEKNQENFDESARLSQEVHDMEHQLISQEIAMQNMQESMAKKLEFLVMFATGDDGLSFEDEQRIASLAKFLNKNAKLRIRLDGYADPRGTDEYNNVLSSERARTVADLLQDYGVAPDRIDLNAHGANFATAPSKHGLHTLEDQYAFKRRVNIEVYDEQEAMASNP
ncbi:MAG: OmpA family protein [Agarilytica sp.]